MKTIHLSFGHEWVNSMLSVGESTLSHSITEEGTLFLDESISIEMDYIKGKLISFGETQEGDYHIYFSKRSLEFSFRLCSDDKECVISLVRFKKFCPIFTIKSNSLSKLLDCTILLKKYFTRYFANVNLPMRMCIDSEVKSFLTEKLSLALKREGFVYNITDTEYTIDCSRFSKKENLLSLKIYDFLDYIAFNDNYEEIKFNEIITLIKKKILFEMREKFLAIEEKEIVKTYNFLLPESESESEKLVSLLLRSVIRENTLKIFRNSEY